MNTSVYEAWQEFEGNYLPEDAPAAMHSHMRCSFYAGFMSFLQMSRTLMRSSVDTPERIKLLSSWEAECMLFAEQAIAEQQGRTQ